MYTTIKFHMFFVAVVIFQIADDREAVQNIVECCKNQDPCRKPVKIKGEKQMVLRAAEDELVAKNGTKSAVVAKVTNKCKLIVHRSSYYTCTMFLLS